MLTALNPPFLHYNGSLKSNVCANSSSVAEETNHQMRAAFSFIQVLVPLLGAVPTRLQSTEEAPHIGNHFAVKESYPDISSEYSKFSLNQTQATEERKA